MTAVEGQSRATTTLLNYIGTRPRTSYLARIKNPNPKMPDAKFIGKATHPHGLILHNIRFPPNHGIHHS